MSTDAASAARRAGHAALGRSYGLFLLAAIGAGLCVGLTHQHPGVLGVVAAVAALSAVAVHHLEAWMRTMDPIRRSKLVSSAGFAGMAVAIVVPFVVQPEWSAVLAAPAVGGLVALGHLMLRRGMAALKASPKPSPPATERPGAQAGPDQR